MNVCFVITKGIVGGAQRFTLEQIELLKRKGTNVYLVTDKIGWLTEKAELGTNNILCDERIGKVSFFYILRLFKFLKRNKISLLICSSAYAGFYGRIAAYLSGIPVVYVSHGWSSIYNGGIFSSFFNYIERLLSLISTSILCVSEYDRKVAIGKIKILPDKCFTISNAIYPPKYHLSQEGAEEVSPCKLLCVCRLEHPKLPQLLVQAVEQIFNVELTIIGGGKLHSEILNYINERSIENVKLIGEINEFDEFYLYDIFCLVSESEGLPISAIEAMSSGLALVLSDVGGCYELINGNGVLVQNDVDDIRIGIFKCIERLKEYKLKSTSLFNSNFNLNIKSDIYFEYYNSLVEANGCKEME